MEIDKSFNMINKRNITHKKNGTDLYIRPGYARWADIYKMIEENTQLIIEKYRKHLNENFNYNEKGHRHVFEREIVQKDFERAPITIEKYEKGAKNKWAHRYDIYDTDFLDIIWFINTLEDDEKLKPALGFAKYLELLNSPEMAAPRYPAAYS